MLSNYICAIDIGSSKIAGVVTEIKRRRIVKPFFENVPAKGVKRGAVVDTIDLADILARLLKNLRTKSAINIKSVYINISGTDITTKHSCAVIPLTERGNKVVTSFDIRKVNQQARILASSLEEEIIHDIPFGYVIDSGSNILNPIGLYSHRLEVDLYLLCGRMSYLQTLARIINQAGCEIKKIFFSGLAASRIAFNPSPRDGIDILCDMGGGITEILIFKDGRLQDLEILKLGGDDLTQELSSALKIPFEMAEDIKKSHGIIRDSGGILRNDEILVKRGDAYQPISQNLVCEILTSKAKLICQAIKEAVVNKIDTEHIDSFVVCGRTTLLEGFLEMLEIGLGAAVKLARITHKDFLPWLSTDANLSGQKYLTYLTSLGILCEALHGEFARELTGPNLSQNFIFKVIDRVKEVYQEYF